MNNHTPPERRQLTVMLCDVVGWSALSLRQDAEELADVIRIYRQRCAGIIGSHGGTVAQYVGDAILAYFGYPRAHEDDAERAIRAALAIAAAERASPQADGWDVHIGIATGIVVVGNLLGGQPAIGGMDPKGREEISAVGSALNLAARLQAVAGPGMVVVSEQTRRLSRGIFEYHDLGRHDLKGFDQPVHAWQAVRESRVRSRFRALRAPALTPLVGRQRELQELVRCWQSVREGEGRAVLLSAEPGVGKSRLAEEVADHIVPRHCVRLWFYCSPHLQSSPLVPVIRHLRFAAGFENEDDDATRLDKLARLAPNAASDAKDIVPLLAGLLSVPCESRYPPLHMSPQRKKRRLFEILLQLLERNASLGPILLVVEDLHWIDPSSDELIGMVIDQLKRLPILAIVTARPEFQPTWKDRTRLLHMPLKPLEREDAVAMIGMVCGGRSLPRATVDLIADKTDGMPLFIEDLTRDLLELADQRKTESPGTVGIAGAPLPLPATLTDSLMSRLDRLGSAKRVAQMGAVIGRAFSHELLARVADRPEPQLQEELDRLVESGLLIRRRATPKATYAFQHALVRDAAYASLLTKERAAVHERIARTLVDDFPEIAEAQPDVLAYHFEAARDTDHAVFHLVRAAKLSARRSGFVEAIAQLERALSLLQAQAPSRERTQRELRVHLALGGIYAEYRGFSSDQCGKAFNRALALCRELGDTPEIFAVLSGVGSYEITRANFGTCRLLAEECIARAAHQRSRPPFIMGHLLLGGTLFLTGEFAAARAHLEQAISSYEQDPAPHRGRQVLYVQDQKSTGLCYLALVLTAMGYPDTGLRAAQAGLDHSRALGGPHTVNYSLCYLAAVHHFRRDTHAALRRATQSLELAREQGFATWVGISQLIGGAAMAALGQVDEGIEWIRLGVEAHGDMDAVAYQPFALSILAQGLAAAGRLDEAGDTLEQALAMVEQTGERFYQAELLRLKGETLGRKGDAAAAENCLCKAVELSRRQEARLFELRSLASLCRHLGKPLQARIARDRLAPLLESFSEGTDAPDLRDARRTLAAIFGTAVGERPG